MLINLRMVVVDVENVAMRKRKKTNQSNQVIAGEAQEIQNERSKNDVELPVALTRFLLVLRNLVYATSTLKNVREQFPLYLVEKDNAT
jgi:hypothetical protein